MSMVSSIRAPSRGLLRFWGVVIAVATVVLPAMSHLFTQPPMPLGVLWLAYGWAAEEEGEARGDHWLQQVMALRAPIALALLGLMQDELANSPLGLMMAIYLFAFLIGRVVSVLIAPELVHPWVSFAVTALLSILVAAALARWAIGPDFPMKPYAETVLITIVLFPFVQPLFMDSAPTTRARGTLRR
jgi:hypothetical protein